MKFCLPAVLAAVCLVRGSLAQLVEAPNVTITQGTVVGSVGSTLRGRTYFSYKGIPYAKPPIDVNRFKAPVPVDASDNVVDARFDGPYCAQKNYFLTPPVAGGVEDCLNVNVYTPDISETLLPVMVFIHGGGFFAGGGASYIYGAKYLLDKDVVLVTFNYRLGALGFLSTGDSASPGNYGMKDQVLLLRWVQENIAQFGGDPDSVTIFGQSAGAACVHFHLFSDMSEGLFHRAISESGSALSVWAWPPDPLPMAQQQAAVFDCPQDDSTLLVECLRQVDAVALADSSDIFHFWGIDPITMYRPVVEAPWDGISEEPFLTGVPQELIRQGRFQKKPWMAGVVAQEGIVRGQPILANPADLYELNANWTTLGPRVFDIWSSLTDQADVDQFWTNATEFYFDNNLPVTADNGIDFIDMYSDRFFMHGIHKSSRLQSQNGHDSIFLYNFNYRGLYSYANSFAVFPVNYGISHNDDLIYLFKAFGLFPNWPENHPDLKVVDSLVTLWTNFATYGTPTPTGALDAVQCDIYSVDTDNTCDLSDLAWSTVTSGRTNHLYINLNNASSTLDFVNAEGFYEERMMFWDNPVLAENQVAEAVINSATGHNHASIQLTLAISLTRWILKHC